MVVKAGQVADVVEAEAGGALERRAGDEQQRNDELRGHGDAKQGHRDEHHAQHRNGVGVHARDVVAVLEHC